MLDIIFDFKCVGIKVWVVIGDKFEIVVVIGYIINLLIKDINLIVVCEGWYLIGD